MASVDVLEVCYEERLSFDQYDHSFNDFYMKADFSDTLRQDCFHGKKLYVLLVYIKPTP